MPLPEIRRKLFACFGCFFLPLLAAAADPGVMLSLLPRHSAIAAGADISALCGNPQSAPYFSPPAAGGGLSVDSVVYSCDRVGRRSTFICRMDSPAAAEKLRRRIAAGRVFTSAGAAGDPPAGKRREEVPKIQISRIDADTLAIYSDYPKKAVFIPDLGGVPELLRANLPRRSGMLIWCGGVPGFTDRPLDGIMKFSAALECAVDGRLIIHGEILCRDALSASLANIAMPCALSFLLSEYCSVPAGETLAALSSLNIRQEGAALRFSSFDVKPVLTVISRIADDRLSAGGTVKK